jgi:hypothetical protein
MSLHCRAWCTHCSWSHSGPDADRAAHLHTTSKAQGHVQHPTASSSHPRQFCTDECRLEKESR